MLKHEGTDKIRDIKYEDGYVDRIYYDNNTLLVFTSDKEKIGVDEVLFKGRKLVDVTSYGKCEQNGTPSPDAPMDIVCNNGVLKYGVLGKNLFDKDTITVGYYYNPSGVYSVSSDVMVSNWIPISSNTTLTLTATIPAGGTVGSNRRVNYFDANKNWLSQTVSQVVGNNPTYTFTTPENTKYIRISWSYNGTYALNTDHAQLEFGSTATPYEPYQAGIYADGTVETINVHGKNLLNPANIEENIATYYTDFPTNRCVGYHLSLKAGTYTYSVGSEESTTYLRYKYNGQEWSAHASIRNNRTTQTYTNDVEIAIYSSSSGNNIENMLGRNVQVEQGSTATEYEPYYDGGTATAEMLLKVGDYQDEQEIISGAVTRKVGVKVLDGTENYAFSSTYGNALLISVAGVSWGADKTKAPLCSHYTGAVFIGVNPNFTCGFNKTGHFYIRQDDFTSSSASSFKQWLADQYAAGTPVIVVYPLAESTTEQVLRQQLTIQQDNNTVEVTQASIDNILLKVKYK